MEKQQQEEVEEVEEEEDPRVEGREEGTTGGAECKRFVIIIIHKNTLNSDAFSRILMLKFSVRHYFGEK